MAGLPPPLRGSGDPVLGRPKTLPLYDQDPFGAFLYPPVVAGASSAPPSEHKKTKRLGGWFGHKAACFCRPGCTNFEPFLDGYKKIDRVTN
jgi:hypothetical protein